MKTVVKRMKKPTPKFFKKLRNIGLTMAAVSATVISAPIALPAVVMKMAGYLAVAGTVMSGVSQTAVTNETE
jgi:hypothetical protein